MSVNQLSQYFRLECGGQRAKSSTCFRSKIVNLPNWCKASKCRWGSSVSHQTTHEEVVKGGQGDAQPRASPLPRKNESCALLNIDLLLQPIRIALPVFLCLRDLVKRSSVQSPFPPADLLLRTGCASCQPWKLLAVLRYSCSGPPSSAAP